jgi:peptidoglycan/xylan/chitin deacetylase (PgdA/CDA1 family)
MRQRLPWPEGVQSALCLTFDLDAETMWTSSDARSVGRPVVMSQGRYDVEVGLPLVLGLLERNELHATFFVPGWVADEHPREVATIVEAGHELGHHGYLHDSMDGVSRDRELEVLLQGIEALERISGVRPVGYRAPLFDLNDHTWELLREHGFLYSSNLMDSLWPSVHDGEPALVEIPVQWLLDDGPYYLFNRYPMNYRQMFPPSAVLDVWRDELDGIHRLGGVMNLTLHPQLSGRPARLNVLQALVDQALALGCWLPTLGEVGRGCLDARG